MVTPAYVFRRGALDRDADTREGVARAGGLFRPPPYAAAYVAAARWTFDRAVAADLLDEMAMPIAYLQRHSLELMIKDLLAVAIDISASREHLASGTSVPASVPFEHGLLKLASLLRKHLKAVGYACPPEFVALAKELATFEDADETRTRYALGKPTGKYGRASFPTEVAIPLRNWQTRLEGLHSGFADFRETRENDGETTLLEEMVGEAEALFQALHQRGLI